MFVLGKVFVAEDIPRSKFCCDLPLCRGACCTIEGERGAPLRDDEVQEVVRAFPVVRPYLSRRALTIIESRGLYEGNPGDFATPCVDNRECVFAYLEDGTARCSFDHAFRGGKSTWRKPLSCHLFPIRVRNSGTDVLYYHQIEECRAGRECGRKRNTTLREFLREPLVRAYGKDWYDRFAAFCDSLPD